jgi:preprotein translocase subunit YajC
LTVLGFIGGVLLLGAIFIFLDVRSDRKERKEREKEKLNK